MTLSIGEMTAETRTTNINNGWRSAEGGPGGNTRGDYITLLQTEISEATTEYRRHRLADMTVYPDWENGDGDPADGPAVSATPPKPEGVGAELADVLIRLLSTSDLFGLPMFEPDVQLGELFDLDPRDSDPELPELVSFGDHMAWLTRRADRIWTDPYAAAQMLLALVTVARKYGIDLDAEYARKSAHNRTREYRHGGALAEAGT